MMKANSKLKYRGRVWYPGQEISGVEREPALKWLATGQAIGTMPEPEQKPEPIDWNAMTVAELKKQAAEAGIEVRKNATKSELIQLLGGDQK